MCVCVYIYIYIYILMYILVYPYIKLSNKVMLSKLVLNLEF